MLFFRSLLALIMIFSVANSAPTGQPTRQPSSQPSSHPSGSTDCPPGSYISGGICTLAPAGKLIICPLLSMLAHNPIVLCPGYFVSRSSATSSASCVHSSQPGAAICASTTYQVTTLATGLYNPTDVCVLSTGVAYVGSFYNNLIQSISSSGDWSHIPFFAK